MIIKFLDYSLHHILLEKINNINNNFFRKEKYEDSFLFFIVKLIDISIIF